MEAGKSLSDVEFQTWLKSIENVFETLTQNQKNTFLEGILDHCASEQLCFLVQSYLPSVYHRDFIRCLPRDCSYKILQFLDGDIILKCCLVSKSWYHLISDCKELWIRLLIDAGEKKKVGPEINQSYTAHSCKQLFLRRSYLNDRFREGSLCETVVIDGPNGTYKITGIMYQHPILMLVSDGKDVYIWNALEQKFDDQVYEITSEQNSISTYFMDKNFLYIGLYNGKALSWKLHTDQPFCFYIGHVNTVLSISALSDKNLVLTSAADYSIKLWSYDSGNVLTSVMRKVAWIRHAQFLNASSSDTFIFLSFSKLQVNAWGIFKNYDDDSKTEKYDIKLLDEFCDVLALVVKDGSSFHIQKQRLNLNEYVTEIFQYKVFNNSKDDIKIICLRKILFETQLSDFVFKDELIGIGDRFVTILRQNIEDKECSLQIRDITQPSSLISVLPVPHFRSLLGEPIITLCKRDWLDGFDQENQSGLIYASPMQLSANLTNVVDSKFRVALCKWKNF